MHKRTCWWRAPVLALLAVTVSVIFPVLSWAGGGWSVPLNLSSSAADTDAVCMVADSSGRVHVVWSEDGRVFHRYKDGNVWTDADLVSSGSAPRLAADGEGDIHLTFASTMMGAGDIYYAAWQAGSGWGPVVNVSQSAEYSFGAAIAVANGNLAIIWSEPVEDASLIYLAESTDGLIWSSGPVPGAQGTGAAVGFGPEGALVAAWEDVYDEGFALDVWAAVRTSTGWSLPTDVSYTPLTNSAFPSLAASSMGVALAWEQERGDGSAVIISVLMDDGWSEGQEVSVGDTAFAPALVLDQDGSYFLAWASADTVRFRSWVAGQAAWGPVYTVATGLSNVGAVGLAAEEDVHIAWLAEAAAENWDAFYSTRTAPAAYAYLHLPLIRR